jgi:hypothetical protein
MTCEFHSRNAPTDLRLSFEQTGVHATSGQQRRHGQTTDTTTHNNNIV